MQALYSFNGSSPEPLPFRIYMPNGFTRTDPSTFTAEEIEQAGYVGPIYAPEHDPATETLHWNGDTLEIVPIPPVPPAADWVGFSAAAMSDPAVNEMLAGLISSAPGLYGGIIIGLKDASNGDSKIFVNSWNTVLGLDLISDAVIDRISTLVSEYNLPQEFVDSLFPPLDELVSEPASDEGAA